MNDRLDNNAALSDDNYLRNGTARRFQSELIKILFWKHFNLNLSDDQAHILSYYKSCDYAYKQFIRFCGLKNKRTFNKNEKRRMKLNYEYFIAHIRVRTGFFPLFRNDRGQVTIKNIIRFCVLVFKCQLYLPNKFYWFSFFNFENSTSINRYLPKLDLEEFKNRLKLTEDNYFYTLRSLHNVPLGDLYGEYLVQNLTALKHLKSSFEQLDDKEINDNGITEKKRKLETEFKTTIKKIEKAYTNTIENLKSVNIKGDQ